MLVLKVIASDSCLRNVFGQSVGVYGSADQKEYIELCHKKVQSLPTPLGSILGMFCPGGGGTLRLGAAGAFNIRKSLPVT